jgi:hypothetical protein
MALLTAATFTGASSIHYQTPMLGAMAREFGAGASAIGWVPTLTFGGFLFGIVFLVPHRQAPADPRPVLRQYRAAPRRGRRPGARRPRRGQLRDRRVRLLCAEHRAAGG